MSSRENDVAADETTRRIILSRSLIANYEADTVIGVRSVLIPANLPEPSIPILQLRFVEAGIAVRVTI